MTIGAIIGSLPPQSSSNSSHSNSASVTRALLLALALAVGLGYWAGGINWAAGIFTVGGMALWLWSARKSYREQGPTGGARLIIDRTGELANEQRSRLSYRRIRVANAGSRALHQVEVTLQKCRPAPAWFEPVRLQRLHGGPHPFSLPPQSEVYIELAALPQGHPEFVIVHDSAAHGGLPNGIAIKTYELTVQVTAQGLPRVSLVFELVRSELGELELNQKQP
ncbi:MAG TPA: hypothetical protein VFK05_11175 [Polyangiaceae bacterium]|nr:hypothetical protein [Polyangiaceae bacterium]